MDIEEASDIVLSLAEENVISEVESDETLTRVRIRQLAAIGIVRKYLQARVEKYVTETVQ